MSSSLKMYFAVLDTIPLGLAMTAVAHGAAAAIESWPNKDDDPVMKEWLEQSFKKVICKVTREQFDRLKDLSLSPYLEMTESALNGIPTVLVFKPRVEWPPIFKELKLYR
jgi:hypothetical protein